MWHLLEDRVPVWAGQNAGPEDDCRVLGALELLEEVGAAQQSAEGVWALPQVSVDSLCLGHSPSSVCLSSSSILGTAHQGQQKTPHGTWDHAGLEVHSL